MTAAQKNASSKAASKARDHSRQGHRPRRLGPQGNRHRGNRDARPDGDARRVRAHAAAAWRTHRRLAAHDHSDRGADRHAQRARRRRALGFLQHLLDAGPCGRRDRGGRHAGLRREGREPRGLLGLHPPHLRVGGRRHAEHDPRRRRRRDHARASRPACREGRHGLPRQAFQRGRRSAVRRDQEAAQEQARLVRRACQEHQGRHRGDDHGRAPPLPDGEGRQAPVLRHQRQRLGDQVEVRQPLWLPRGRWWTAFAAAPT